jgi:two-component system sensor histidine kinase/response regulator
VKTILLIDDDARLRLSFGEALRIHGYRVLEASSASAGLEIARQQLPDLILSDVHMPGDGDGSDLLRQIRQDPELCNKQVVLVTGSAESVTLRRGMEMGADDFLLKPVELGRLLRCIEARLARAQTHWRVQDKMLSQLRHSLHSTLPHEFFTPLAGIVGLAGILRAEGATLSPTELGELHNDIYFSGLRLHRTLRNYLEILDLQGTPAHPLPPPPPLSPGVIRQSVQTGIEAATERCGRESDVTYHVANRSILAKAPDLSLMVEEMVDNACKYSRTGTPVTVHVDEQGTLTVTDSGRGMPPDEIEAIGAFQQFDRKKHEQQGLGLGLLLVKKLAVRNGASFVIESPAGSGWGTRIRIGFRSVG